MLVPSNKSSNSYSMPVSQYKDEQTKKLEQFHYFKMHVVDSDCLKLIPNHGLSQNQKSRL